MWIQQFLLQSLKISQHLCKFKHLTHYLVALVLGISTSSWAKPELGHVTVFDPHSGFRDIIYEKINGFAVVEGDILLMPLPKSKSVHRAPQALILLKLGGFRWPHAIVPFKFAESLPYATQLAVLNAMQTWEKVTHVHFVELSPLNLNEFSDYLLFMPSEKPYCSSSIGRQGGPQPVILGAKCTTMKVAHELGHALGLWHEQSRADRDQYVKIVWENIIEGYQYNFNQHINEGEDFGEYDYQSIMHYKADNFSKNGEATIIPLQPGAVIGQHDHLTTKDIAAVNAMYPEETVPPG